jgi:hypothetical protein
MFDFLKESLTSDSNKSSTRVINYIGAITGTALMVYDTYLRHGLDNTNFAIFMGYCVGGYGVSKYLDYKKKKNADGTSVKNVSE